MSFQYSCFISYRREEQRNKFIQDFCKYLNTVAKDATNLDQVFIDSKDIANGVSFPDKLYNSIMKSCVFTVFHTPHYLHLKDNWCAKELYYALKVEKIRRNQLSADDKMLYSCLLVLIVNGTNNDLPKTIKNRATHSIGEFEYFGKLLKNTKSDKLIKELGKQVREIDKIYQKYPHHNFVDCCKKIPKPKKKDISDWIQKQKSIIKSMESKKSPILKKK